MEIRPISFRKASDFIAKYHRHHEPPQGLKFALALHKDSKLVGVCTVGRPVSRVLDDGLTAEVTRLCTDGTQNACSKLYAAAWKTSHAMGYKRIITYILSTETGISLKAAGWTFLHPVKGRKWGCKSRPRDTVMTGDKKCYGTGDLKGINKEGG